MRLATTALVVILTLTAPPVEAQMGGMGGGGPPGGGPPPGGRGGPTRPPSANLPSEYLPSASQRIKAVLTIAGRAMTIGEATLDSDLTDQSVALVARGGTLTLNGTTLTSSAEAALLDDVRQAGVGSALLLQSGGTASLSGVKMTTTGKGGTAIYAGAESHLVLSGATRLTTRGSGAHALEVRPGAEVTARDVNLETVSDHAPAVSVTAARLDIGQANLTTFGPSSPLFEVAGELAARDITGTAERADAVDINQPSQITLSGFALSGRYGFHLSRPQPDSTAAATGGGPGAPGLRRGPPGGRGPQGGNDPQGGQRRGPQIESAQAPPPPGAGQSRQERPPSGPGGMAPLSDGPATSLIRLSEGRLVSMGPVFHISYMDADVTVEGVELVSAEGVLVRAMAGSWGELGRNGSNLRLNVTHSHLQGAVESDVISRVSLTLGEGASFSGTATPNTDISLSADAVWNLTADSGVGRLSIDGVSTPDAIMGVNSNGHIVTYSKTRNPWLEGKTWPLPGGGKLVPGI